MNERVRLANEVLARIETRNIVPHNGGYYDSFAHERGECRVCAAAALAVACCGIDDLVERTNGVPGESPETIAECLSGIFPTPQLALIEIAYEGDTCMPLRELLWKQGAQDLDSDSRMRAAEMFDADNDRLPARTRMVAIMENIVANDGEFRP